MVHHVTGQGKRVVTTLFGSKKEQDAYFKKHGLVTPRSLPLEQSDLDFFEEYAAKKPAVAEQKQKVLDIAGEIRFSHSMSAARSATSLTNEQMIQGTFGKEKEKSAAGAMVKGAVLGSLIGGGAGAVVGAMVAKEQHEYKNKSES